ncbi:MAG TPA: response regulator [Thermoanaerobaculia bacterium]|nr:response regulator [Thermoanaerobaculia bacterium]
MNPIHYETPRVLVADDDAAIRQLVGTIIRREGLEADCVADGGAAIDKLEERDYAVVLLDLMMPRVSGFDVIDYLRDRDARQQKPLVLVITAYADQTFKAVDPHTVAGVLRKPFEVAEIGELIRMCVQGLEVLQGTSATFPQLAAN